MSTKITNEEKLFNPNYTYIGDPSIMWKDYPTRSKNLSVFAKEGKNAKKLNKKFIKDGYMYLLRGAKAGQETGFYSEKYAKKKTIENLRLNPNNVAYAQSMNGNTPFISATTELYTAASFAEQQRIYILKVPVEDIYTFYQNEMLMEEEYMIPDYIAKEEIIKSFRYDKFKQIYNFLTLQVGLKITPEDLRVTAEDLSNPDIERIEFETECNNSGADIWDPILKAVQDCYLDETINNPEIKPEIPTKNSKKDPIRRIGIFTDAHGLAEPVAAVLKDMREKGIEEIYSLGDNVGLGPNPKEVMDLFDEYNVISLAGNYEEMINLGVEPFSSYLTYEKIKDTKWTKSVLTQEQINKIKQYPHSINLEVAGHEIALCHFANDVRCDFDIHSTWKYQSSIDNNIPNCSQFLYTNSKEQLLEFASVLGMDKSVIISCKSPEEGLKLIRDYVNTNKINLSKNKVLGGYLSYIEDPLFIKEEKIQTVKDYSAIIQGHTHFVSKVQGGDTTYYSVRAVGMGYSEKDKNQAHYVILNEYDNGYDIEKVNVEFDRARMENSIKSSNYPNNIIKKYTKTI